MSGVGGKRQGAQQTIKPGNKGTNPTQGPTAKNEKQKQSRLAPSSSKKAEERNSAQGQSPQPPKSLSKPEVKKKDLAQGLTANNGKQPDGKNSRPLVYPTEAEKKKALLKANENFAVKTGSAEKLEVKGKELSKELKILAQELSITEGSDLEIIEAACREIRISKETFSKDTKRVEQECFRLKEIIFNEELLKLASFDKIDESQRSVQNAEKIAEELKRVCKKMETDQMKIYAEVLGEDQQPRMEELLKAVKSIKKAADEGNKEIQRQKTELEKMEREIAELKGQLTDARNEHQALVKSNQEKEQKLTDELNNAKSQKDNALTRLSEVAGAKLTESNPLITDLSDPNRPEKIGEQFSELYDNLWTDVFEKLNDKCKLSERDSIHTLLQILEESYGYCKSISSKRYTNILAELTLWKLVEPNEESKKGQNTPGKKKDTNTKEPAINLTMGELQTLRTLLDSPGSLSSADSKTVDSILAKIGLNVANLSNIKKMLKSSLGGTSVIVQKNFWKQHSGDPKARKEVLECTKPFLMKCVQICWLMLGQDPPVYLRFSDKSGDKFDKDVYREYTVSGKVLDFVVWPAIYLHENGPLLKKGVAQPTTRK